MALSIEQIRSFRLQSHNLTQQNREADVETLAGACGMQNTPPGAWETALYNRASNLNLNEMEQLLYKEKKLLQAWSMRGAPVVFPTSESDVFLSPLIPEEGEPWIYTNGVSLALDFLQMTFDELFEILNQVMPQLNSSVILSKTTLDKMLSDWILPKIPAEKHKLWNSPSMYGSPDKQTVGGAVVSFMLRPCSFKGLVVFGERSGISPTFTSYKNWTGHTLTASEDASKRLVRKYLHCYGPTTVESFQEWLGCSGRQGRRLWKTIIEEIEPVDVSGKKAFILTEDRDRLYSPAYFERELLLLGGHDPFLDQRDREILQIDKSLHKQIWKLVFNPGAIVWRGEVIGTWTNKKKGKGMEIKMSLWTKLCEEKKLINLAEEYAAFRQQKLMSIDI